MSDAIADHRARIATLARDPLVRLVMASDGVSETEFVTVLQTAQRAVAARSIASPDRQVMPPRPALERRRPDRRRARA